MRVLVDTNVVLDILLDRRPHSVDSLQVFKLVEEGRIAGLLCATTITTIDYLLTQSLTRTDARKHLAQLIRLFDIAPVNRTVIEGAMKSPIADFEDAVLEQAALLSGAEVIITWNVKNFSQGVATVLDPKQFLVQFGN